MEQTTDSTGGIPEEWTEPSRLSLNLRDRLLRVRDRIAAAANSVGRETDEIALLAVTKRKPAEIVRAARECGLRLFGENYVQEAAGKKAACDSILSSFDAEWHLIGHLQSNKAQAAVQTFTMIQSLDSEKLAKTLSKIAVERRVVQRVLIQVHLGNEPTKTGVTPDGAQGLIDIVATLPSLSLEGLMGIAPVEVDPAPHFQGLRRIFDNLPPRHRKLLSMGMSADYETAIREGSTMVRIGTALFGSRR